MLIWARVKNMCLVFCKEKDDEADKDNPETGSD